MLDSIKTVIDTFVVRLQLDSLHVTYENNTYDDYWLYIAIIAVAVILGKLIN